MIILDRSIDFLTPLLRQITYEGLVDEFYGINGGVVRIPSSLLDDGNGAPKERKNESAYKSIKMSS